MKTIKNLLEQLYQVPTKYQKLFGHSIIRGTFT